MLTYGKLVIVHDGGAGTTLRQSIPLEIYQFFLQPASFSRDLSFLINTKNKYAGFRIRIQFSYQCGSRSDFLINADPDPTFLTLRIRILLLIMVIWIGDHWGLQTLQASKRPLWATTALHGPILILERSCILTLMQIRIRFVTRTWTRGRLRHTRI